MDTLALVVVRMGGERRFASLLRICGPVDDVDCWEEAGLPRPQITDNEYKVKVILFRTNHVNSTPDSHQ